MTETPSEPTRIEGIHFATGQPIALAIDGGVIQSLTPLANVADASRLPILAPGLIDLQINGFAGRDFNQLPLSTDTVGQIIRLLWREGVTCCYPTIITNSPEAISAAMTAIARAC